jgi:hypothetical protein
LTLPDETLAAEIVHDPTATAETVRLFVTL